MLDLIADLVVESIATSSIPWPESLARQRRAALAVAVTTFVINAAVYHVTSAATPALWQIVVLVGDSLVALGVLLFSAIDLFKEAPVSWLSVMAAICSISAMGIAALIII
jgi:hypothetical protein